MPKYLLEVSYTAQGAQGLLKDGSGTKRRAAAEAAAKSLGGSVETFYFSFRQQRCHRHRRTCRTTPRPRLSVNVGASGALRGKTTVLFTVEEMDAAQRPIGYRPPGA